MGHELGLTTLQMAEFVARGVLAFEGVVPEALNARFLEQLRAPAGDAEKNAQSGVQSVNSQPQHSENLPRHQPARLFSIGGMPA